MSKVKLYPLRYLADEQIVEFTIDEMEKLRLLSGLDDFDQYNRTKLMINQLIKEMKKRNIHMEKTQLAKRILFEE